MKAQNWLRQVRRRLFPVKVAEAGEPPARRVIIFSVYPAIGIDMGRILEARGFKVRCIIDYAAVPACCSDSWSNPDLVLVNAGAQTPGEIPLAVIKLVREYGYQGTIIGCAAVTKVQEEMKEAGATETCTPHLWMEAVFPHLGLQPDLLRQARSG